jgi:hypothetical protein
LGEGDIIIGAQLPNDIRKANKKVNDIRALFFIITWILHKETKETMILK